MNDEQPREFISVERDGDTVHVRGQFTVPDKVVQRNLRGLNDAITHSTDPYADLMETPSAFRLLFDQFRGPEPDGTRIRFTGNFDAIEDFVGSDAEFRDGRLLFGTTTGPLTAAPGDWIVRQPDGTFRVEPDA
jgi:hypothetical protein